MHNHTLHRFTIIISLLLVVAALCLITVADGNIAHAGAPTPAWWIDNNGYFSQYDDYQYKNGRTHQGTYHSGTNDQLSPTPGVDSYMLSANASYDGVAAIGPRWGEYGVDDVDVFFTTDSDASQEEEWECTELSKRFLYLEYGARSLGGTFGYQVVNNYVTTYPTLFKKRVNNGTAQVYPKPGDVVSYGTSQPGHTAVVQSVTDQSNGSATVQLLEQNASALGYVDQDFSNWQFHNGIENDPSDPNTISAWLEPLQSWSRATLPTPSGTTAQLQITSMSSTSSNDVWAVGYYYSYSYSNYVGYAAHYDGTSWTVYSTPRGSDITLAYYNNGVSATSNGVFVVGYYMTNTGIRTTTAYKWNTGTNSWDSVSSANPYSGGAGNVLTAVAADGNGHIWAVGYGYIPGTGKRALIEQWNGTAFVGISSQPTNNDSQFNAVAVSSSANAWAVGTKVNSGNKGMVYHYNGSTWAEDTSANVSTANVTVRGVVTLSDSEAWLTGDNGTNGLVEHYVSNSWASYTTVPNSVSTSLCATAPGDVWDIGYIWDGISGSWAPYTYHYNGSSWTGTKLSRSYLQEVMNAVTCTGSTVWMGGYRSSDGYAKYLDAFVYR